MPLLQVDDLRVSFQTDGGPPVPAVDSLSLSVDRGEVLGLVGESGCGKSVSALSIIRLLPDSARLSGSIRLEGAGNLLDATEKEMNRLRGASISIIFQEPMTALNPVHKAGRQIGEVFRLHRGMDGAEAARQSVETLRLVGIDRPEIAFESYPHELSGGMRQRVLLAMALACRPKLLIADEPTTALDVTVQAQILMLIQKLQKELGMALLLISHDLAVVAEMADRVAVMYAGEVVEEGPAREVLSDPRHPYTRALLRALPRTGGGGGGLEPIGGRVPAAGEWDEGCRFRPRCPLAVDRCATPVDLFPLAGGRKCRCVVEAAGGGS